MDLEAARLLVYQAAWLHDSGAEDVKQKSSMAKLNATEAAQRIIDQALQIHGANGLMAAVSPNGCIATCALYESMKAHRKSKSQLLHGSY